MYVDDPILAVVNGMLLRLDGYAVLLDPLRQIVVQRYKVVSSTVYIVESFGNGLIGWFLRYHFSFSAVLAHLNTMHIVSPNCLTSQGGLLRVSHQLKLNRRLLVPSVCIPSIPTSQR